MSELTMNQYQEQALSTAIYPGETKLPVELMYVALKLCGEAGEVAEKVGKIIRDKGGIVSEEDRQQLLKEAGDVQWYIAALCDELGAPLADVGQANLDKLASRKARGVLGGSGDVR